MCKVLRAANQRPWEVPPDGGGRPAGTGQNRMKDGITSCDQGHVRREQRDSVQSTLGRQWGAPGSSMDRKCSGLGEPLWGALLEELSGARETVHILKLESWHGLVFH